MNEPTIVCIVGMHRSGTSLVAQLLHALGLDLGPEEHLMRPSPANPTGHWENEPITELNDDILTRLGGTWSRPPELAAGWERTPELDDLRHQARELIRAEFAGSERWGFKDPRTSLTLPFWQRILPPMRYVICLRNPVDVAFSLRARTEEPLPFEEGVALWLAYVRSVLAAAATHSQLVVFYEDLMVDPEPAVRRLATFIGNDQTEAAEAYARAAIRVGLSESLWHHRTAVANVVDEPRLPFHVKALYLALRLFAQGEERVGIEAIDLLGNYAAIVEEQGADLEQRLSERRSDLERAMTLRAEEQGRRDALQAELELARAELARAVESGAEEQGRRDALQAELELARAELARAVKSGAEEQGRREGLQAELELTRAELTRAVESEAEEQGRREGLQAELELTRAELTRAVESEAEEQGRREGLEAELQVARSELARMRSAARGADSEAGKSTTNRPPKTAYDQLVDDVRARVLDLIPSGATVLVASKGDDKLAQLDGRPAWHFPGGPDGRYLGYHPAGDTAVIAQLEAMRARGADHLVLPATTLWWLDHYDGLRRHLEDRYVPLLQDERCTIYSLRHDGRNAATDPIAVLKRTISGLQIRTGRDPSVLDWHTGLGIADHLTDIAVFVPPGHADVLPYVDRSVDIVVVGSADATALAEAGRVAAAAVVRLVPTSRGGILVDWQPGASSGWGENASVVLLPGSDEHAWVATASAIAETLDDGFSGQLGVVGSAATLGGAREAAAAAGVQARLIEVSADANFAQRGHAAAGSSAHPILVFVAAPAAPLPNWLPSMLALFSRYELAGVVGTRILSPSGHLREAGGILAADGSPQRRGEGDQDPDRPEYHFVKRVDFCSRPLLATHRDVFARLKGFDDSVIARADALADFSLRAGRAAVPVYYQPEARVVSIGDADR